MLEDNPGWGRKEAEEELEIYLMNTMTPRVGGESMWVRVIEGDENEGVGMLVNEPDYWSGGSLGTVVRYAEGTDTTKPRFIEVITDDGSHG